MKKHVLMAGLFIQVTLGTTPSVMAASPVQDSKENTPRCKGLIDKDGKITISLKNKKTVEFINEPGEGDSGGTTYTCDQYLKNVGYYVFSMTHGEDMDGFVLNERDGTIFNVNGTAFVSPNETRIIFVSGEGADSPPSAEIWRVLPDKIEREWKQDFTGGGLSEVKWKTEKELDFIDNSESKCVLRYKKSVWSLEKTAIND